MQSSVRLPITKAVIVPFVPRKIFPHLDGYRGHD